MPLDPDLGAKLDEVITAIGAVDTSVSNLSTSLDSWMTQMEQAYTDASSIRLAMAMVYENAVANMMGRPMRWTATNIANASVIPGGGGGSGSAADFLVYVTLQEWLDLQTAGMLDPNVIYVVSKPTSP